MKLKTSTPALLCMITILTALTFSSATIAQTICCKKPIQPSSSNVTAHNATLNWCYMTSVSCFAPVKFKIQYHTLNVAVWQTAFEDYSPASVCFSHTLSNLLSNTTYQWHVRTLCQQGGISASSPWTALQTFTTTLRLENSEVNNTSTLIYPNPASDHLTIDLSNYESGIVSVRIVNLIGQTVIALPAISADNSSSESINISSLPEGNYFVEITNGQQRQVMKFVKE